MDVTGRKAKATDEQRPGQDRHVALRGGGASFTVSQRTQLHPYSLSLSLSVELFDQSPCILSLSVPP